jgi:hypothetical protein
MMKCDIEDCNKEATFEIKTDVGDNVTYCDEHLEMFGDKVDSDRITKIVKKQGKYFVTHQQLFDLMKALENEEEQQLGFKTIKDIEEQVIE